MLPAHRVFIWTIGCQMNRADGERIQRELQRAGHAHADTLADATAVVVNGCAVRDNADRKVWGMLGMLKGLKKSRPHLVVGLTGCTVHADDDELKPHLDPVDVLFDTLNAEPLLARLARSTLLEVLRDDYIRTARAKGLAERWVILRHALRNAILPVITLSGVLLGFLLGGSVVVEKAFGVPGLGSTLVVAFTERDYVVIQNLVLLYGLIFVVLNLLVDISYAFFDPRIRYS